MLGGLESEKVSCAIETRPHLVNLGLSDQHKKIPRTALLAPNLWTVC